MNTRLLGRTGLQVSEIGFGGAPAGIANYLGAWDPAGELEATTLTAAIHRAVDLGVNYFDTAPGYGNGMGETRDHVNEAGLMREAEARGMGIVTMRSLTSGIFQKLMRLCFPREMEAVDLDRFCLNYVLSNPLVDVALVGMRRVAEVEANAALSDDTAARLDLRDLHHRQVTL